MSHDKGRAIVPAALLAAALIVMPSPLRAQDEAALERGKQIFTTEAVPPCGVCHTLADAGTGGKIGPDLDELKPTKEMVQLAVSGGVGLMPPYESLAEEQIEAVALYVSTVAGAGD